MTWGEDAPASVPVAAPTPRGPGRLAGKAYDGDAAFRRIEANGRRGLDGVCSGC